MPEWEAALDYTTFVLLPQTKNPLAGMMMETDRQGTTVIIPQKQPAKLSAFATEFVSGSQTSPHMNAGFHTPPKSPSPVSQHWHKLEAPLPHLPHERPRQSHGFDTWGVPPLHNGQHQFHGTPPRAMRGRPPVPGANLNQHWGLPHQSFSQPSVNGMFPHEDMQRARSDSDISQCRPAVIMDHRRTWSVDLQHRHRVVH